VLGADTAQRLLVPTTSGLYLVDADAAGVTRRTRALTDRSRSLADVELDEVLATPVPAPVDEVLRAAGLRAAVLVAADALGVLLRVLDMTVEQVLARRQFGVAVGSFQAVKHAAAQMLVTLEAARSIVYLAAASVQEGHPDATLHAAAATAQVCADVAAAADTALVLHGASGYTWEHDLQIFYKRAKLDAALFGSAVAWNERIAAELPLLPTA
jgi:alkylation response protein AidB-like acyl-CoA dehydrogenase